MNKQLELPLNTFTLHEKDKILVPVPSIIEQKIIVKKLDAISAETKKLEAIYQQKINDLEELKKSILQKAFSGELKTEKRSGSMKSYYRVILGAKSVYAKEFLKAIKVHILILMISKELKQLGILMQIQRYLDENSSR